MKNQTNFRIKNNCLEILINAVIYPQEPLFATCCVLMDKYYILIDLTKDKKRYKVTLFPKEEVKKRFDFKGLVGDFHNELLNNVLRYKLASRNQKIRQWIVQEALFFNQPKKEQETFVERLACEEKYGKDKD